jgi:hypothetical protein
VYIVPILQLLLGTIISRIVLKLSGTLGITGEYLK